MKKKFQVSWTSNGMVELLMTPQLASEIAAELAPLGHIFYDISTELAERPKE